MLRKSLHNMKRRELKVSVIYLSDLYLRRFVSIKKEVDEKEKENYHEMTVYLYK